MTYINPLVGTPATVAQLFDLARLLAADAELRPGPALSAA
jgi:hypothetical protein